MSMPVITPSNTTKCEAIADLLESVALMEAALSHILNAEGEKIQAAIGTLPGSTGAIAQTTSELLQINESVDSMVTSVTLLEGLLQKKLNQALSVDCPTGTTGV